MTQPILHIRNVSSMDLILYYKNCSGGNGNLGGISLLSNKVRLTIYGFGKACSTAIETYSIVPAETDSFVLFFWLTWKQDKKICSKNFILISSIFSDRLFKNLF